MSLGLNIIHLGNIQCVFLTRNIGIHVFLSTCCSSLPKFKLSRISYGFWDPNGEDRIWITL